MTQYCQIGYLTLVILDWSSPEYALTFNGPEWKQGNLSANLYQNYAVVIRLAKQMHFFAETCETSRCRCDGKKMLIPSVVRQSCYGRQLSWLILSSCKSFYSNFVPNDVFSQWHLQCRCKISAERSESGHKPCRTIRNGAVCIRVVCRNLLLYFYQHSFHSKLRVSPGFPQHPIS